MQQAVFNSEQVKNTLNFVLPILEELNINYRVLGSVVTAAINGGLHRNLGDIDLVVESNKHDTLRQKLFERGYRDKGGMFKLGRKYLSLDTMEHNTLLEIGLFTGSFTDNDSLVMGSNTTNISVESHAIEPHTYHLLGHNFKGLPPSIVAAGINTTKRNPKREREKVILKEKGITAAPNSYIHVRLFGIRADWVYYYFTAALNALGVIRVAFGKPYDPWR